jgi:hypothetical protein
MAIDKAISYRQQAAFGGIMGRDGRRMYGGGSDMGSVADSKGNVGPGTGGYQGGPQGGYGDAGSSNNPSGDRYRSSRREYQQAVNNAAAIEAARKAKEKRDKRDAKNKNITKFGYAKPKSKFSGILGTIAGMMLGIPGLGLLTGGFDKLKGGLGSLNETLGDFREKTTGFRTQAEYDAARQQRQLQGRLDNMYDRKSKGKNFSQKNMDMLESMGLQPSTAQNVLTGRDLKGFTDSRMGLQTIDRPTQTFSFDNSGMTRNDLPSNNYVADAYNTPTEGAYGFNLIELDKLEKAGYDPKEVYEGGYGKDLIKSLEPSGYTDADFTNEYGYPMTAGLLDNIGVRPAIKMENTGLGFSIPTGDVGLNASGRLGNLSATVDAIDALKGESVNPQINYSGNFGNTTAYGNFSDDVQNLGLNFNNDKGLSGGISYDAITGEPRFDIGFRRTFADGGLASMFTRRG